jgi:hypothetical protein
MKTWLMKLLGRDRAAFDSFSGAMRATREIAARHTLSTRVIPTTLDEADREYFRAYAELESKGQSTTYALMNLLEDCHRISDALGAEEYERKEMDK